MRVTLFTKPECTLCDQAKAQLQALQQEFPHTLVEVDISNEATLSERYAEKVPVIQVGPYTLEAPFDERDLRVTLGASRDGLDETIEGKQPSRNQTLRLNQIVLFFGRHWLAVFNLLVFIYVGLPFAAPVLMKAGVERPARVLYTVYSPLCHQLAFRSWFLFGEQAAYPRELASTAYSSYSQVTGMDGSDLLTARNFVGNEQVGYKVGLCERDIGIYGGILLAGLAFSLVKSRLKPLPIGLWILFGIAPIALDGFSQLLAGFPLPGLAALPARESTPFLRTLTGGLFGVMNVWMAYPYVEETMAETRALVAAKIEAARASPTSDS